MNKFKLFVWPLLVVIAGIVIFGLAMFAACVPAKADMNSFLQTLANKGYTGPIANWEKMGIQICLAQAQGYDARTIARAIVASTGTGIYSEEAYEIILEKAYRVKYEYPGADYFCIYGNGENYD